MGSGNPERVLRQHLATDRLLGVQAVPVRVDLPEPSDVGLGTTLGTTNDSMIENQLMGESKKGAGRAAGTMGVDSPVLSRDMKLKVLDRLDREQVRECTKCGLCESRIQTVFGEGDPDSPVLFVGEGPGQNEDEQGRPFVGRAGDMLNKQIVAMGLEREQVYIANIVKCRPPNNRAPTPVEVDACWEYLRRQVEVIRPKVIVTLGGPATKTFLGTKMGITAIRGTWHEFDGLLPDGPVIPVMPTFHPAYLLRAYTPENRKKVWSDLQQVMQRFGGG